LIAITIAIEILIRIDQTSILFFNQDLIENFLVVFDFEFSNRIAIVIENVCSVEIIRFTQWKLGE